MKKSLVTLLLMLFCCAVYAQQNVSGVVIEEATSEPLAGAAIQVKDSQSGTIADAEGRFTLSVSPGQTLLISYIGMIPQEILVKGNMTSLTIKMLSDAVDINEVVVELWCTEESEPDRFGFFGERRGAGASSGS